MEKDELREYCKKLQKIIEETNNSNVYDKIIEFFQLTSELHDRLDEIQAIPVNQKSPSVWMWLFNRKNAKEIDQKIADKGRQKLGLCQSISHAGRTEYWNNRSKKGERITKYNIYFGGVYGLNTLPVAKWEECKNSEPKVYNTIASQMTNFVKSYEKAFTLTEWF